MPLRRMLRPAPVVGLNNRSRTACWFEVDRPRMTLVRPNASEMPKPSIGCRTLAPLMVAAEAAYAGAWLSTTRADVPIIAAAAAAARASRLGNRTIDRPLRAFGQRAQSSPEHRKIRRLLSGPFDGRRHNQKRHHRISRSLASVLRTRHPSWDITGQGKPPRLNTEFRYETNGMVTSPTKSPSAQPSG